MVNTKRVNKKTHKKWIVLSVVIVAILAGAGYWYSKHHTKLAQQDVKNGYTSHINKAHDSGSKTLSGSGGSSQGGVIDHKGTSTGTTNTSSASISSDSGIITVEQPVKNSKLSTGATLSGSAKVGTVNFRLIDDSAGVLAQGSLSVVSGKFSGTLQFKSVAQSGRLDVFSYDSSGIEINEVQIPVGFE